MNAALSMDLFNSGATATTSANSDTASATSCNATQQASNGISAGAAAGIGLGVGLPLAIAVGALTFMLMREKKRSRISQAGDQQKHDYDQAPSKHRVSQWDHSQGHYTPNTEVSGLTVPHELGDTQRRSELGR